MSRRQRGVAAVEFALVLPLFITMLLGMIDYGWYFFVENTVNAASREGARAASTHPGDCPNPDAAAAALTTVHNRLGVIGYIPYTTVTTSCTTLPGGDPAFEVQVLVLFPQLTGFTLVPMPGEGPEVRAFAQTTMRGVP